MRGRLILAGQRFDDLTLDEVVDAAEATLVDAAMSLGNLDEVLAALRTAYEDTWPERETWGMTPEAARAQADLAKFEAPPRT